MHANKISHSERQQVPQAPHRTVRGTETHPDTSLVLGSKSAVSHWQYEDSFKKETRMTATGKRKLKNVEDCPHVYSRNKHQGAECLHRALGHWELLGTTTMPSKVTDDLLVIAEKTENKLHTSN